VVQTAAKLVLEPIFEEDFEDGAYGYRPARGAERLVPSALAQRAPWIERCVQSAIRRFSQFRALGLVECDAQW
jgi:retron-type reverse transcriptase